MTSAIQKNISACKACEPEQDADSMQQKVFVKILGNDSKQHSVVTEYFSKGTEKFFYVWLISYRHPRAIVLVFFPALLTQFEMVLFVFHLAVEKDEKHDPVTTVEALEWNNEC